MSEIRRICEVCPANAEPGIDPVVGEENPQLAIPFYVARDLCIFQPMDLRSRNRAGLTQEIAETCYYTEAEGGYELRGDEAVALRGTQLGVQCGELFLLGYCGMAREEYEASNEVTLL